MMILKAIDEPLDFFIHFVSIDYYVFEKCQETEDPKL